MNQDEDNEAWFLAFLGVAVKGEDGGKIQKDGKCIEDRIRIVKKVTAST